MDKYIQKRVDDKYLNIYRWIVWVIKEKHSFSFVDKKYTRKFSKLDSICTDTLIKYMTGPFDRVKVKIALILPDKFGGIFDGWSRAREHYLAFFALWAGQNGQVNSRKASKSCT
jgi:hypothetical protein